MITRIWVMEIPVFVFRHFVVAAILKTAILTMFATAMHAYFWQHIYFLKHKNYRKGCFWRIWSDGGVHIWSFACWWLAHTFCWSFCVFIGFSSVHYARNTCQEAIDRKIWSFMLSNYIAPVMSLSQYVAGYFLYWSWWRHRMVVFFCVTGLLCRAFTGHRWISLTEGQ